MDIHSEKFKIRLGLFIIGGLALFVVAVFLIGKQKNLFNPVFKITATFANVSGLQVGNNIRFAGINVGTVDNISIINDSSVKIDMLVRRNVKQFIKSDCKVAIGSEGLIGDRLLVIAQGSVDAPLAKEGQQLASTEPIETDAIMKSLQITANHAEVVSKELANVMLQINSGNGTLGKLIHNTEIADNLTRAMLNLKASTNGIQATANNANIISKDLAIIMNNINSGNGTLGRLIQDSTIAGDFGASLLNLKHTTNGLQTTTQNIEIVSKELAAIMANINSGNGTLGKLIQDSTIAGNFNETLSNLKRSTQGLDDNMQAIKESIFFKGYFNKKEAAKKAQEDKLLIPTIR